jgi:hypothetical protein
MEVRYDAGFPYYNIRVAPGEDEKDIHKKLSRKIYDTWAGHMVGVDASVRGALDAASDRVKMLYNTHTIKSKATHMCRSRYVRLYEDEILEDYEKDIYFMVAVEKNVNLSFSRDHIRAYIVGFIRAQDYRISCGNKVRVGETFEPGGPVCTRPYYAVQASSFDTDILGYLPHVAPSCPIESTGWRAPEQGPSAPDDTPQAPLPQTGARKSFLSEVYVFSESSPLESHLYHNALLRCILERLSILALVDGGGSDGLLQDRIMEVVDGYGAGGEYMRWSLVSMHFLARAFSTDPEKASWYARAEKEIMRAQVAYADVNTLKFRRADPHEKEEFMKEHRLKGTGAGFLCVADACAEEVDERLTDAMKKYAERMEKIHGDLDHCILDIIHTAYLQV